ncbi:hypothetical protein K4F52_008554 [Lecanicillium sp. MT-2017a]|nr:hypothetical protein K4F52_008554 [Lecanicillium sp. MT-2017a]
MKYIILGAYALGIVAAAGYSGQPDCIIPCLESALPQVGCALEDSACACQQDKRDQLASLVRGCAMAHCSIQDLMKAKGAGEDACKGNYLAARIEENMNRTRVGVAHYPNRSTLVAKPKPTETKCNTTLLVQPKLAKATSK